MEGGWLLRCVLFKGGADEGAAGGAGGGERWERLLIAAHHLITDGVSWRLLLGELQEDYEQALAGAVVEPVREVGSFPMWAERLTAYADSDELAAQEPMWREAERAAREFRLPLDASGFEAVDNTGASAAEVTVSLTSEETHALLREVPRAYRSRIQDALLAALGRALNRWTGRRRVAVWFEGHGREQLGAATAASTTVATEMTGAVGWFTALYPVAVEAQWDDEGEALKASKEALRSVPDGGVGYGVWKYGRRDDGNGNGWQSEPGGVVFNYLGQLNQALEESPLLMLAAESPGPATSPLSARSFLLEINGAIINGRLQLTWTYSRHLHHRETIERVAADYIESLRGIIEHCRQPESRGFTPSDFPEAKLNQEELDELARGDQRMEDLQPLSPMQKGMLFHRLYNPESGEYVAQFVMTLRGDLNPLAFKQAWQQVVRRHAILRTDFICKRRDEPLQIVREQVDLPWEQQDWSELTLEQQEASLNAYLQSDRRRGFELTRAPLLRLLLIRTSGDTYRLVWTLAMMLLDGWSVPLLLKEVFLHYEAMCRGTHLDLERPRPYRDYIAWLQRQSLEQAEHFWRERLSGFTSPTQITTVNRRVSSRDHEVEDSQGQQQVRLSAQLTAELVAAARRSQLTLNTMMQGAWAALLSRYSGEREVLFGMAVAGRPAELSGVEQMVGLFINTLPVRVRLGAGEQRLSEWLRGLQAEAVEMRQYEHSPLVEVQRWSDVPRGTPLFETMLVFDNYPFDVSLAEQVKQKTGLEVPELRAVEQTNFPLTLTITPGDELGLTLNYERSRFDDETIGRMLGHLERLLAAMASNFEQRVVDLPLLSGEEQHRMLFEWNETRADFHRELCLHELFEAQVERTPEAVAVRLEAEQLTYRELNERANRLAHRLIGLGVGPEGLVGILAERSIEMVVALLGVLKAGGAYVPLDPFYPQERLQYMLEDSGVNVLLSQRSLEGRLPRHEGAVVWLDDYGTAARKPGDLSNNTENPQSAVCDENLAYVIYTSGSTGRPKGVAVQHRSLVNYIQWYGVAFDLQPGDRPLQFFSINFDASAEEIYPCLTRGATLVLRTDSMLDTVSTFLQKCAEWSISVLSLPVAYWHEIVAAMISEKLALPASIRLVTIGAEAALPERVAAWQQHVGSKARLINTYGPTEATIVATIQELFTPVEATDVLPEVTIGRPVSNVEAYVLDEELRTPPIGVVGHLHIGGLALARGYLRQPELTAEKFIPHLFSREPGARLYRTGDAVRRLPDGRLEYVGRIDDQVKIRGFRVELGEIAAVLFEHTSVVEAVVQMRPTATGERRLVAYVVLDEWQAASARHLREFLKERLPEYMVPALYVEMKKLPLTRNGKVDRRALPEPEGLEAAAEEYVRPRTPEEELLAGIWAEVLGIERVGVDDDFFELGGHSLLATQVVSRVREAFRVELPLRKLFESPTVAKLAQALSSAREDSPVSVPEAIGAGRRERQLPLSFAQQRLWFIDQLEPGRPFYNVPVALRLSGRLDVSVLRRTLGEVVRRHEVLRTTFPAPEGTASQRIAASLHLSLPVIDLSALAPESGQRVAHRLARSEAQRPFDLAQGPLLRATMVRHSEAEHVALFTMHHIVSDAWSMDILVNEVAVLYRAYAAGQESPLSELPIQYADYAVWQREWLDGDVLESQLKYWRKQLTGAPSVLDLPVDHPRPAVQSYRGAAAEFSLGAELSTALKALSRREGVTLFMTLLAGFQALLSRYAGSQEVVLGTAIANRTRQETEGLIGFFVNTLVLRTDLSGNPRFTELLRRVREVCLGAYAHQDVPFERLVEELRPERSLSHSPLFQVAFGLNNAPRTELKLPGLELSVLEVEDEVVRFDLTLWIVEEEDGSLLGRWTYRTELFEAATIERISRHWETLLQSIVASPDARLLSMEMLTEEERQRNENEERARESVTAGKLLTARRKTIRVSGDMNLR
jgi:amino acid adenylation domain-containing protein/non-ribosomal peptide synthase protein (TIGR01720 family)